MLTSGKICRIVKNKKSSCGQKEAENMNDKYNEKDSAFYAHVNHETGDVQYLQEHLKNVRFMAEKNCPVPILKNMVQAAAILHDMGKYGEPFQEYMKNILKNGDKAQHKQIDHSSAGGLLAEDITRNAAVSNLISTTIYSHHGLLDCIDMESGEFLAEKRRKKELDFEIVKKRYFQEQDREEVHSLLVNAHKDMKVLYQGLKTVLEREGKDNAYGSLDFYLGLYERLMLSLLIDSDWSDTASAMNREPLPERMSEEDTLHAWEEITAHFTIYMEEVKKKGSHSPLDKYRTEISNACYEASQETGERYRLTVPTGAGKTLSSLRFALNRAEKYRKQHIFYIAPFNSILEQNAEEIRLAAGGDKYVLEHHCNVVNEDPEQEEAYRKLTENWDCPIIATTAVQLLNTLFSGEKSCIRRMYTLCNSILIFDEVQAIPTKCTELFHLAVNFLTEFCNTTVVLCSATQPSLAPLAENNILKCKEMTSNTEKYAEAFRRVVIEDKTDMIPGGMKIEDIKSFTWRAFREYRQVLVIVNTKPAALRLYEALHSDENPDCELYHLSTNMCPENRADELKAIKRALHDRKQIICISTSVAEAGIDFSFGCVIRSLAGLDSIVQAAGRCNRHKERPEGPGKVFIIKVSADVEHMEQMWEMRRAQEASARLLYEYHQSPEAFCNTLDSQEAVTRYYRLYYHELGAEITKYPVSFAGTNLVEVLGINKPGQSQYGRYYGEDRQKPFLKQAFRMAGKEFEVISQDAKISLVVPYNKTAKEYIVKLGNAKVDLDEKKRIVQKLQRFTVGIAQQLKDKLGDAIYPVGDTGILALNASYYDKKTGIRETPKQSFLDF